MQLPLSGGVWLNMLLDTHSSLIALVGLYAYSVAAVESQVDLSYGKFMGTPLSNGITQWLGIPFAAPPVGDLRFAPPIDPPKQSGVQQADKVSVQSWQSCETTNLYCTTTCHSNRMLTHAWAARATLYRDRLKHHPSRPIRRLLVPSNLCSL